MYRIFFFLLVITFSYSQEKLNDKVFDSILIYRESSKNQKLNIESRISNAKKAILLSISYGVDSTLLFSKKSLSSLYLYQDDIHRLKSINKENLFLAEKIKDSSSIADANYILGYAYHEEIKLDSAYFYYYNAVKLFSLIRDYTKEGEVLLNMADIQKSERDFIGAEINAINAKKIFEKLPKTPNNLDTLWSIHNLIAVISSELELYDRALEYHELAINYADKMKNGQYYKLYSKSNIASTYRKKGDFVKAANEFNEILKNEDLESSDPSSFSVISSNLAYSRFLIDKNDKSIEDLFKKSLSVSKKVNDKAAIMSSSAYYSEYLNTVGNKDSAKYYSDLSYKIAKKSKANNFILQTLKIKAAIDKDSSRFFLTEHIKLSDSLLLAERSKRNKFARIEYETDEIIQENQQMSRQRLWLIITSIGLLVTLFFLYIIKSQREKNKELQIEKQQQEANEEIYNLMLTQQDKIDEVRSLEKNRISKDIHDGILGKLFGVRLSLDSLNLSSTPEATEKRSNYISELKNIEEDIRKVSHELNTDFIQQSGYLDIIKTLIDTQMTAYGISYTLSADEDINWDALNNKIKIHVYRILQETMQNAYKHANATIVDISFKLDKNLLTLGISDNGEGFDLQKAKKGIGLKNINSRIREINGEFEIKTQKKQGTKIVINVPTLNN